MPCWFQVYNIVGFPGDSVLKNLPASAGDEGGSGLFPGSGRFPGGRKGNSLHYSCLENSMDRGSWLDTTKHASIHKIW